MLDPEVISILVNAVVSVFVAILGYQQRSKRKEDESYRELREKLEKEREEAREREKAEEEERLKAIEENIQGLTEDMRGLQKTVNELTTEQLADIRIQLKNLHTMESNNFVYSRSLSGIIVNIGEILNSASTLEPKLKERLDECIEEHKKKENDIHEALIKLIM